MIIRIKRRVCAALRDDSGFGLIELLASMFILAVAVAALLAVFGAGAYSLARSGHVGTASAVLDSDVEYYHRAPWASIHLVQVAVTPNPAAGGLNEGTTAAASNTTYANQCGTGGCAKQYISTLSSVVPQSGDSQGTVTTCGPASGTPGDPTYDSEVPPTWCAAVYDVTGPDGAFYRTYTYMAYGCGASVAAGTTCDPGTTDYTTKIVSIVIRRLDATGTAGNILAQQTFVLNHNSFRGS